MLAKGVAQVPQSQALFPQMTIRENVLLGGYTLRRDKPLLTKRYDRVSELIPIVAERSHDKAGNLSGGQRRMVEIARCLMVDPSVLLLDEPSLGLDPKSLTGVSELVRDANAGGTTVLLVEQNVRLGLSMATHGVVLEGGRVRLEAPAGELMANPEVAELYLGGHAHREPQRARRGCAAAGGRRHRPVTSGALPPPFAGFSAEELARRRTALEAVMAAEGLDHVVLYGANRSGSAVSWLTEWPVTREAHVLVTRGEPRRPAGQLLQPRAGGPAAGGRRRRPVRRRRPGGHAARAAAATRGAGGAPGRVRRLAALDQYAALADGRRLVDLNRAHTRLRLRKSDEELARAAARGRAHRRRRRRAARRPAGRAAPSTS